jgi:hypothetical protein
MTHRRCRLDLPDHWLGDKKQLDRPGAPSMNWHFT